VKLLFKDYHYKRFLVFLDPELDPTGKGYNIQQSKISIGSGGFMGQGFTKGKQNRGNFLPAEDTDFIISLVAEEWGFLGIIIVLGLYLFLIYRCLYIAYSARDFVGSMIAAGITSMYIGHIMLNIFSAMGFFPVIGVPLPFLSYGGSSLLTSYLGLGILFNIKMRRFSYN
jgi:rod shape determining protein RodA